MSDVVIDLFSYESYMLNAIQGVDMKNKLIEWE